MRPALSHGDLHKLEYIEDRSGGRRKHGLPVRYSKGKFLGKGGFAKCYEVTDVETNEIFAAKIVAKESIKKPRAHVKLRSEIAIHRSLDHEKVVKFYDYFEDNDFVYIILELCPNQTLNEFMRRRPNKRLSEQEAVFFVHELLLALKYLHRRRVIHRDLKLGNLFLDEQHGIKVGDFGLAAQLEHDGEKKRTICGTPNYIAPEILEGKSGHSFEVDTWSLGVIIYTMVVGRPPFETSDVKATYRRIRDNRYSFPDGIPLSNQVKDLVGCILRTDPRSRPSLDEIMSSPWLQQSRLPPQLPPTSTATLGSSPRALATAQGSFPGAGSASARSETPERGVVDVARIDSPATSRNRSPSNPPAAQVGPPTLLSQRSNGQQHSAPVLGVSKPSPPTFGGTTTPGRHQGGHARPPLASHRGNEENVPPQNGFGNDHDKIHPLTPTGSQASLGNLQQRCRPHSGQLTPTGSAARLTPHASARQSGAPPSANPLSSRQGAPARFMPVASGPSPRSAASSPRQPGRHSGGHGGGSAWPTTPKVLAPSRSEPSGVFAHATPNGLRNPAPTSGRKPHSSESPTALHQLTPGLIESRPSARARKEQRDSSSPAFLLESLTGEPPTSKAGSALLCGKPVGPLPPGALPELWVTKWVDYSSKYGVGYILSDGSIGVYFNDSTKIALCPDEAAFDYITRRTQETPEIRSTHTFNDYPDDLKKKVTLLRHFKNYMVTDVLDRKDGATVGESGLSISRQTAPPPAPEPGQMPYVKKWTRNKHAIMFQLSNKVVQVIFFDKTEAVLSSRSHMVTYVDKKGQASSYPLSNVLDVPSPELAKRLRYTKDILVNLLGARTADLAAGDAH